MCVNFLCLLVSDMREKMREAKFSKDTRSLGGLKLRCSNSAVSAVALVSL